MEIDDIMKLRCIFVVALIAVICMPCFGNTNNGKIELVLAFPFIQNLSIVPEFEERYNDENYMGALTLGVNYYHSENQYVSFRISGTRVAAVFSISWLFEGFKGDARYIDTLSISVSNNHNLRRLRLNFGYGFSFSSIWLHDIFGDGTNLTIDTKRHSALGLIFTGYFRVNRFFDIGFIYQPTFFRPNMSDKFVYEHIITLDFLFKIPLNN